MTSVDRRNAPDARATPADRAAPDDGSVLDDLDSRPGSASSLLRTAVGCYLRELGGWIATAHLVELMEVLGVPGPRTRTALTRVKAKGLLVSRQRDQVPGYALADASAALLARGDRRIYEPRSMTDGDRWCLISFTVPESERRLRHQLRRRLAWIGCGIVSPALWICPEYLADEVADILAELGLSDRSTLFYADVRGTAELPGSVTHWWDLEAIAALHTVFLRAHTTAIRDLGPSPAPKRAFATWTACIDTWRIIPYLDPGLPRSLLPDDWPGKPSIDLFLLARDTARDRALAYARSVTESGSDGHDAADLGVAGVTQPTMTSTITNESMITTTSAASATATEGTPEMQPTTPDDALSAVRELHRPSGVRLGIATCVAGQPGLMNGIGAVLTDAGQLPDRRLARVRPRPGEPAARPEDLADFIRRYGHEYTTVVIDAALADDAIEQACADEGCALVVTR
jgi:phenylacetic acid degradation operon negative regulatory protein